jgi:hypothetical protein
MKSSTWVRCLIRYAVSAYIVVMLVVSMTVVLLRTFRPGTDQFFDWVSTPAAMSALNLSVWVVTIVVPLNVIFGVAISFADGAQRFSRQESVAGDHRSAVRSLAHHRGRRPDRVVWIGRRAGVRREQPGVRVRTGHPSAADRW